MDLVQMRSYVTVVNCRSFAAAARELHMAKSTVTGHIQRLEQELDCQLILRSTHSVSTTESGEAFYRFALQVLGLKGELDAALLNLEKYELITTGAISGINHALLPDLLAKYRGKKPSISFDMQQAPTQELLSRLRSGVINVAFTDQPCADSELECLPLGSSVRKLLVPNIPGYAELPDGPVDMFAVAEAFPFVLHGKGHDARAKLDAHLEGKRANASQYSITEVTDVPNIISCIRAGLGYSCLPLYVTRKLERDPAFRVLSCEQGFASVYMVHRKNEAGPHILNFIKFVQTWVSRNRSREDLADYE